MKWRCFPMRYVTLTLPPEASTPLPSSSIWNRRFSSRTTAPLVAVFPFDRVVWMDAGDMIANVCCGVGSICACCSVSLCRHISLQYHSSSSTTTITITLPPPVFCAAHNFSTSGCQGVMLRVYAYNRSKQLSADRPRKDTQHESYTTCQFN